MWTRWREEMRGSYIFQWEMEAGNYWGYEAWIGRYHDNDFGYVAEWLLNDTGCI